MYATELNVNNIVGNRFHWLDCMILKFEMNWIIKNGKVKIGIYEAISNIENL